MDTLSTSMSVSRSRYLFGNSAGMVSSVRVSCIGVFMSVKVVVREGDGVDGNGVIVLST